MARNCTQEHIVSHQHQKRQAQRKQSLLNYFLRLYNDCRIIPCIIVKTNGIRTQPLGCLWWLQSDINPGSAQLPEKNLSKISNTRFQRQYEHRTRHPDYVVSIERALTGESKRLMALYFWWNLRFVEFTETLPFVSGNEIKTALNFPLYSLQIRLRRLWWMGSSSRFEDESKNPLTLDLKNYQSGFIGLTRIRKRDCWISNEDHKKMFPFVEICSVMLGKICNLSIIYSRG